jgi:hypothetical protein
MYMIWSDYTGRYISQTAKDKDGGIIIYPTCPKLFGWMRLENSA